MSTTMMQTKRCVKCGTDVTGQQRMKNGKGEYWCMDCGGKDEANKTANLVNPCPSCKTPVHTAHLIRQDGRYVCEHCAGQGSAKGKAGGKRKLFVILAILAIGAAAYVYMNILSSPA